MRSDEMSRRPAAGHRLVLSKPLHMSMFFGCANLTTPVFGCAVRRTPHCHSLVNADAIYNGESSSTWPPRSGGLWLWDVLVHIRETLRDPVSPRRFGPISGAPCNPRMVCRLFARGAAIRNRESASFFLDRLRLRPVGRVCTAAPGRQTVKRPRTSTQTKGYSSLRYSSAARSGPESDIECRCKCVCACLRPPLRACAVLCRTIVHYGWVHFSYGTLCVCPDRFFVTEQKPSSPHG